MSEKFISNWQKQGFHTHRLSTPTEPLINIAHTGFQQMVDIYLNASRENQDSWHTPSGNVRDKPDSHLYGRSGKHKTVLGEERENHPRIILHYRSNTKAFLRSKGFPMNGEIEDSLDAIRELQSIIFNEVVYTIASSFSNWYPMADFHRMIDHQIMWEMWHTIRMMWYKDGKAKKHKDRSWLTTTISESKKALKLYGPDGTSQLVQTPPNAVLSFAGIHLEEVTLGLENEACLLPYTQTNVMATEHEVDDPNHKEGEERISMVGFWSFMRRLFATGRTRLVT